MGTAGAAEAAAREIRALFGEDRTTHPGVLHVAAVWEAPDGRLLNLRIGPQTPKSDTDTFVLEWARARADAIVTTGRILRDERELQLGDERRERLGLAAWRRQVLGKVDPPSVLVLSRGEGLDFDHPVFASPRRIVVTGAAAAQRLGPVAAARGIEVVSRPEPGLVDTLGWAKQRGFETTLVEAGPSTNRSLYGPWPRVDELLLSRCQASALPAGVAGEPFVTLQQIRSSGLQETARQTREEAGHPWTFTRYTRDRPQ